MEQQHRTDRYGMRRQIGDQQPTLVGSTLPDLALADPYTLRMGVGAVFVCIGPKQPQARRVFALHLIYDAELGIDKLGQLAQQQAANSAQIALALQHIGEFGEICLKPILLGIVVCGEPQIIDHRIDVVL